jgi:hypothetical protein
MGICVNGENGRVPVLAAHCQVPVCPGWQCAPRVRVTMSDSGQEHGFPARLGDRAAGPEARPSGRGADLPGRETAAPGEGRGRPAWRMAVPAAWVLTAP